MPKPPAWKRVADAIAARATARDLGHRTARARS